MSRRIRARKQRVVLRSKQRVVVKQRVRSSLGIFVVLALLFLAGKGVSNQSTWAPGYVQRHTPEVEVKAPETLAGLALLTQRTPGSFLLWLPGFDLRLRNRWMKEYPEIANVEFHKHYLQNRIVAQIQPRIPLVRWQDQGIDKEGMVFALDDQRWTGLPKANLPASISIPEFGRWLAELSRTPALWSQVIAISQDVRGEMWLDMQTGTHVAWGMADLGAAREKAKCLAMVLEDAHQRLKGTASADVRFFEEGRVIVKPKLAT